MSFNSSPFPRQPVRSRGSARPGLQQTPQNSGGGEDDADEEDEGVARAVWQPRFTLGSILVMMTVACVVFAAARYGLLAMQSGIKPIFVLILATLAGPMLILILVSQLKSWTRR